MRNFWALPAILRVALASQPAFSVHDDVLAYPQYEVFFSDYVTEQQAELRLNKRQDSHDPDLAGDVAINTATAPYNRKNAKKEPVSYEEEEMILGGQRYLCQLPIVNTTSARPDGNQTLSKEEEEKELVRANNRGWELLQGMQGNCVYFWSGWWSYRYCHGQGVKQFHQLPPSPGIPAYPPLEDPGVVGFTLGSVKEPLREAGKDLAESKSNEATESMRHLETRGDSRYLVQQLAGGTICDLTGKERRIEVQFHCNPASGDKISHIKEVATCAYLMIIQTPRLCNDVAFLPPQKDSPNGISCSPIIPESEVEDYVARLTEELMLKDDEKVDNPFQPKQSKPPPSVGGIVLGANKWVPKGQLIEKSAIVGGGGKETYVETIADSMGKLLSADQLKKMNLGDAKSVEKLKKELEKIANGQQWKLEVFDTPQGREYRGVLLGDEDPQEDDKKQKLKLKEQKAADGSKKKKAETSEDGADEKDTGSDQTGSEETYKDEL